jgi:dynein assembly factor 1, axonemal
LQHLTILDLSNNRVTKIENLSCCPNLQTLNLSHNALTTVASMEHLRDCPALNNVDVTNNHLEADEGFFSLFAAVPLLSALSCNGNDITKLPTFRKKLIAEMPQLGYLDRPVDLQERTFAEAFVRGGPEAEAAARAQWKLDVEAKRISDLETYRAWQEEQRVIREANRAAGKSLITEVRSSLLSPFSLCLLLL